MLPGGGHSQIYERAGSPLAKPSGPHEGGIPYAETDLADIEVAKHFLDTVRHYARPDMLSLKVNAGPVKHVYHIVVAGLKLQMQCADLSSHITCDFNLYFTVLA